MEIIVVGVNHTTAPVELRETLAFNEAETPEALKALLEYDEVREGCILSTCNRVEVYGWVDDGGEEAIKDFLCSTKGVDTRDLEPHLYRHRGDDAVRHLFKVICGLDSMVLGEPQIGGQVKDAYELALKEKATGLVLNQLMKKAISVAKRVRSETGIGEHAVSVSFAAVELAKKIFDTFEKREAMLIGAGEMAELAARHLVSHGVGRLVVANRTLERAQRLAQELGGEPVSLESLEDELVRADIVISSTASQEVIIKREQVERAMKRRRYRPVFFIDIAVPRDIDPEVGRVENVYLYDIDDLETVVEENRKRRAKEAERALQIIEREVEQFKVWMREQSVIPVIVSLRKHSRMIVEQEMHKTFSKLDLTPEQQRSIEKMADAIVKKILHPSFTTMKQAASEGKGEEMARVARRLFGIEEER